MADELSQIKSPTAADFTAALGQVAGKVLETMFFTEAVVAPCEHSWFSSAVNVQVGFDGSHCGAMRMAVSEEAVAPLASSFLGLDSEEARESEKSQVILELANIVCGAVLSSLWPESKLLLDAPQLAPPSGLEEGWHCCLELPEGRVAISIRLDGVVESA